MYVDRGLEELRRYGYAVVGFDGSGNPGTPSQPVTVETGGIAPPAGLRALGEIGRVVLEWEASAETDLRGYNVYRSSRSDAGYERLEGAPFTTGQTAYTDSGLAAGDVYFYRVSALTSQGESGLSAFVGTTVLTDDSPPGVPTFLEGVPLAGDPSMLEITWTAPNTDAAGGRLTGLQGFQIYRSPDEDGPFKLVGTATEAAFVDTGLKELTTYFYQVEAVDQAGNSSPRSATTPLTTGGGGSSQERVRFFVHPLQSAASADRYHKLDGGIRCDNPLRGAAHFSPRQHGGRRFRGYSAQRPQHVQGG